ncbi:MAG: ABC transporter permease [Spirochaetae bacterium HGW-Spirochaetae-3]|nr:MAG: ABC transporter permease [Spirochaetae bacterium HGW-Spirochaetae-3]
MIKQFGALFKARTMEYVRDRGTFYWSLLFPVFLVLGLAFAFSGGDDKLFKVGVVGVQDPSVALLGMEQVQLVPYPDAAAAAERLARHQIDFMIDFTASSFAINAESSKGRLVRDLFLAQQATAPDGSGNRAVTFSETVVTGKATRYVDWLVPGVIGMNMMFSSLFGVGFVIVRYRKNGVLKRFKATPVSALNFVSAQAASRLVIVLLTSVVVFAGTNAFLHFMMRGSYVNLLLLTVLGILCMISLGLVFASRMRSEEMANGVLNIVTFPMLALSGVFFSLEGSPQILRTVSRAFPLTHFIEAARKIMLDGAGLAAIAPNLLVLGALTVVFLAIGSALFQWE